ncbi:hypothetical protein C2E23DRAFT_888134 [Lenzites betulinus]|nr:hypothetical protein C2E23DRAFT_888134 [Lenzites betulinus]
MDARLGKAKADGAESRPHRTYQYTPTTPPTPDSNPASSGAGSPQTHEQQLENKKRFQEGWRKEIEDSQHESRRGPEEERGRRAIDTANKRYGIKETNVYETNEDNTPEATLTKRQASPTASSIAKRPRTAPQSLPLPDTNETEARPLSPLFFEPRGLQLKPNMTKMIQLIRTAQGELAKRGVEVTVDRYATTWVAREATESQGWEPEDVPSAETDGLEKELQAIMQTECVGRAEQARGATQDAAHPDTTRVGPWREERNAPINAREELAGTRRFQENELEDSRSEQAGEHTVSQTRSEGMEEKKNEQENTREEGATVRRPAKEDGETADRGGDRQNPTETRAEFLTRKGALNVTPPPPEGYPEVHARDPYDHLRRIPRDKLKRFLQRPADTTCMVDIFGTPPSTPTQASELESNLRAVLATITGGKRIQITHPEAAITADWHEEGSSTIYMVYRLPPGSPTILRTQRMWDTTLASFRALDEEPLPPRFLYALAGVTVDTAEAVREELARSLVSGKASEATKIVLRGDPLARYNLEDGPKTIATSLRVKLTTMKPARYADAEQEFALVYCDPPTKNNELWIRWRDAMAAIKLESATGPARADIRCGGCHGADHTTKTCPYDKGRYPGWKGTSTLADM